MNGKCKRQRFWTTLNLFAAGCRPMALRKLREITPQISPTSTFYRHLNQETVKYANNALELIAKPHTNKVFSIDNYARYFARSGIQVGMQLHAVNL